ncbi:MAG: CheR family methyltransferase [Candidatus Methylumidiphilus sp.]
MEPVSISQEFRFTEKDFRSIQQLIYAHAGIALGESKRNLVYSRISRRLRNHGLTRFSDYLALLESNEDECQPFINSLTTNLTSFFREQHHFPILAEHIRKLDTKKAIHLWCSAASTGEETYSMAMTVIDLFGTYTPPVRIMATDIDTQVLETARTGVYGAERVGHLTSSQLKRFFLRGSGSNEGFVKVRPELQDMVKFQQLNLMDEQWPLKGPFDAIFCRNVMIYFDKMTQKRILDRFVHLMEPRGLLFAGHSENFQSVSNAFKPCGRTVYELIPPHSKNNLAKMHSS